MSSAWNAEHMCDVLSCKYRGKTISKPTPSVHNKPLSVIAKSPPSHSMVSPKNAFVAVISKNHDPARVFVVRAEKTGKWMLPGGIIDPGEDPEKAAKRELKEESGYDANYMEKFTRQASENGTVLFKTKFFFPNDKTKRKEIFDKRGQYHRGSKVKVRETDDYGWAQRATVAQRAQGAREIVIVDYGGDMKGTQEFRGGTVNHLRRVLI